MYNKLTFDNYSDYKQSITNIPDKDIPTFHDPYLNCFHYSIRPWKYIHNWPSNIRQFFRNLRFAWQRATQGYCDYELWNMNDYLATLLADMLDDLAANGMGYPGIEPYDTPEKWEDDLKNQAFLLRAALDEDNSFWDNPYYNAYMAELETRVYNTGEGVSELARKYMDYDNEVYKKKQECMDKVLDWLKKNYNSLWD